MNDHHLILGKLTDVITGRTIDDTLDERYRQDIARTLIEQRGYQKTDIQPQAQLTVSAGEKCARVPVTFLVNVDNQPALIIHYGPGSLVTRHRPALAMGRLVANYQIPVVVVTNGEAADILEGGSGKIIGHGISNIPTKRELKHILETENRKRISPQRMKNEARIVMAFEVDDRCPCDDTVCRMGNA